jgi:hypothetical protein
MIKETTDDATNPKLSVTDSGVRIKNGVKKVR